MQGAYDIGGESGSIAVRPYEPNSVYSSDRTGLLERLAGRN